MQISNQKRQAVALRQESTQSLPTAFMRRIELCRGTFRSNCRGTALFIAGESNVDEYIDTESTYSLFLEPLNRMAVPRPWCIVAWAIYLRENKIIVPHMAVITSTDSSTLVAHRLGSGEQFLENQLLEEAGGYFH